MAPSSSSTECRWCWKRASSLLALHAGGGAASADLVRLAWADVGYPTPFRVSVAGPGGAVLLSLIYDTLTWKDDRGIIPWLATRWDVSPDGLEVNFTLAH